MLDFLTEFLKESGINIQGAHALMYLLVTMLGALGNTANAILVRKEVSVKDYYMSKPGTTLVAIAGTLIGWVLMLQQNETSLYTYVLTGFFAENVFNRFTASGSRVEQRVDDAFQATPKPIPKQDE